ncbi:MAG: ABC transporter permease [Acidobacteria bacterium]|nr:ABC transporter permease [Acidobacteriota bacterium]
MNSALMDLRHAFRLLASSPAFTVVALIALALGIGANTAIFTVVNGVLLSPLPYPHPNELVRIYERTPGVKAGPIRYLNFLDWQRSARAFSSMAIYRNEDYDFTGQGQSERLSGYMVSADFFRTLGIEPTAGRTFRAEDDVLGAGPVAVLGGGFWRRRFGGSAAVVGQSLALNGVSYTIIGVMPESLSFYGNSRDVYTPIGQWRDPSFRDRRISVSAHCIGRMQPGVTLAQAGAELDTVARDLAAAYPQADRNVGVAIVSMKEDQVGSIKPYLLVLIAAVGFVLLIACTNVANLVLSRALGRSREFAVRAALGAGQGRIFQQLLTEGILLSAMGAVLGLLLAFWGTRAMILALPGTLPRANEVAMDARVLLFALALSIAAGTLFGVAPALQTATPDLHGILKKGGRGSSGVRRRLQAAFVVVEVALALVLLAGAGLMIRSLAALWRADPGFNPRHAITFNLSLAANAGTTSAETRARLREFDRALAAIPGVEAVSVTLGSRPMIHDSALPFWIEGRPRPATDSEMPGAMFYLAEAGFQQAMGITLARGRFISSQDDERTPPVVDIDDVFARTYFPGEDPIGKHIHLEQFGVEAEIIGVVGHVRQWGLDRDPQGAIEAQFYYPFMQLPERLMPLVAKAVAVVLRTPADPRLVMAQVRRAVASINPGEVIYNVETMEEVVATSFAARRLSMVLLSVFAALALVLASVGIYGVASYMVSQRVHEFGIRMALGAQPSGVLRLVLREGVQMATLGALAGMAIALSLSRLIAGQLFGVKPNDPLTFAAAAALLAAIAVAACYVPARRAVRVDPVTALRDE